MRKESILNDYLPKGDESKEANSGIDHEFTLSHEFSLLGGRDLHELPVHDQEENAGKQAQCRNKHVKVAFRLFEENAMIPTVVSNGYFLFGS